MVYVLLGTGFEETEAIAPIDLMRRAGIPVLTVGLNGKIIRGGHGIGVECYDFPSIAPGDKTVLEPGMTLCVETPFYELGWGGVQIEDTIVIEETGARCLDKTGDALIVLEVE